MEQQMATIPIFFKWRELSPDARQWKVASPVFEPADELLVMIEVPLTHEFIHNSEDIIKEQLAGGKALKPILTLAGKEYIEDAFIARIKSEEKQSDDDEIKWEDDTEE